MLIALSHLQGSSKTLQMHVEILKSRGAHELAVTAPVLQNLPSALKNLDGLVNTHFY